MYNERTILPLITQIKTIFEQEIVDFAVLDNNGIRYHYADFLVENSFPMYEAVKYTKNQQLHYYKTKINDQVTIVFYNLKKAYLVVVLEEELYSDLHLDTIYNSIDQSVFFDQHLDIALTKNHEHDYAMVVMDYDGKIRVMNKFARSIFKANLDSVDDFESIIKDYRAFYASFEHAKNAKENTSFLIDTIYNQRLQTYCMIDKGSKLIQLVFTHQPLNSFYSHILDGFDYLRLGVVHFGFIYDKEDKPVDGRILYANERYGIMMQESISAMIGRTIYSIYPNYPQHRFDRYAKVAQTGNRNAFEDYNRRLDKHFHVYSYSPKKGEIINVYYETTHYHRMKTTERIQLKKIQMMLSLAEMGFFEIDLEKEVFQGDDLVNQVFGSKQLDYNTYKARFKAQLDQAYKAEIYEKNHRLMKGDIHEGSSTFKMYRHMDHKEMYLEYYLQTIDQFEDGRPKKILGLLRNVTEKEKQKEKILHLANHDTLTGLYNRRNLAKKLKDDNIDYPSTIVVFDLDGLKPINDIFGHYEGDKVLESFAAILKETYPDAYIARVGGDEFLGISDQKIQDVENLENILIQKMKALLKFHIPLSVSVGYSTLEASMTFKEAFMEAEEAMYRNKLLERPQRRRKTLDIVLKYLIAQEPHLHNRIERLKTLAHRFMHALKFNRSEDLRDMDNICQFHAIGRIDQYTDQPAKDNPFTLENLHDYLHVELAFKILSSLLDSDKVARAVLHQCERYDGLGEPQKLKGDAIPYLSRIFAIVLRYDQLLNCEDSGALIESKEAVQKLKTESETYFDPELVKNFIEIV